MAPFDAFSVARGGEVADLRRLIVQGPPRRRPFMAESPTPGVAVEEVLDLRSFSQPAPSMLEGMEWPSEQPDD